MIKIRREFLAAFLIIVVVISGAIVYKTYFPSSKIVEQAEEIRLPDWVDVQLIHKHSTARTGIKLEDIKNVVIHYVGNPNSTAQNNRDYFNKPTTRVSSHFVVGLEGEVIQCVPLYERSAASNHRNKDTISIETCHPDESGKFNQKTYKSLVRLTAFLCNEFDLTENDVIRHYDITGKGCPKYFVDNSDAFEDFKKDVGKAIDDYRKTKENN